MIVVIDGPAGAGKSTVARLLARRLGCAYLDTGAMYRTLALAAIEAGIPPEDGRSLGVLARELELTILPGVDGEPDRITLGGRDVTDRIRTPQVTAVVSQVSAHPSVRDALVDAQRSLVARGDWVADGRDLGSVVWPDADVKVLLTADDRERARRRHRELQSRGESVDFDHVLDEVRRRDRHDSQRATSPLVVAADATVIDCSDRTAEQVVDAIAALVATLT